MMPKIGELDGAQDPSSVRKLSFGLNNLLFRFGILSLPTDA